MSGIYVIIAFLFGTFIGSFLDVIVFRLNTGRGIGGRSHCMTCGKTLTPGELIPVVSYCVQKGKCRVCKARISFENPLMELLTGATFALIFWKFRFFILNSYPHYQWVVLYTIVIFSILLIIFFYDLKHKIIPNSMVYPFIILSFFSPFIFSFTHVLSYQIDWTTYLSGILVALPLFLLWLVSSGRWIGFGDVKLALGLGFFLGLYSGIAALMMSFWIGAIASIILLIIKGKKFTMKSEIPFAPFIVIALAIAFFASIDVFSFAHLFS